MSKSSEKPATIYLKDYKEPDFLIKTVDLTVELGEEETIVTGAVRRQGDNEEEVDPEAEKRAAALREKIAEEQRLLAELEAKQKALRAQMQVPHKLLNLLLVHTTVVLLHFSVILLCCFGGCCKLNDFCPKGGPRNSTTTSGRNGTGSKGKVCQG